MRPTADSAARRIEAGLGKPLQQIARESNQWCCFATRSTIAGSTPSALPASRNALRGRYVVTAAVSAARSRPYLR
jgi:hypothetical protein